MSNKGYGYTEMGRLSGTLKSVTNPIPEPGDDEVVIKLKAMALNPVDEQLYVPDTNHRFAVAQLTRLKCPAYGGLHEEAGCAIQWRKGVCAGSRLCWSDPRSEQEFQVDCGSRSTWHEPESRG
jgi:hypothetical protein